MKIKQIAVTGVDNNYETQCNVMVYALTEDDKIYQIRNNDPKWHEVPPLHPGNIVEWKEATNGT